MKIIDTKFGIGATVAHKVHALAGAVVAVSCDRTSSVQVMVEYLNKEGTVCQAWFAESELKELAANAEVVTTGASANTKLPEVEAATKGKTKEQKPAQTAAKPETGAASSPADASPPGASPSPESKAPQSAAAFTPNQNHLAHFVHAAIKKGPEVKKQAAEILASFKNPGGQPCKSVPMIQVPDYPAAFDQLSKLVTADELAGILTAVAAKAA